MGIFDSKTIFAALTSHLKLCSTLDLEKSPPIIHKFLIFFEKSVEISIALAIFVSGPIAKRSTCLGRELIVLTRK